MAWLTTYGNFNKIVLEDYEDSIEEVFQNGISWKRTVSQQTYKWVGMTQATAELAATATNDPETKVNAVAKRENAGGAYMTEVNGLVRGPWVLQGSV
jgi:hypothetical protein